MHGTFVIPDATTGAATVVADPDDDVVAASLAAGEQFWLDVDALDGDALRQLGAPFEFHPLAVEDAEHFGQRPKIDVYDTFTLVVAYGVTDAGAPVEVHCFYSEHFLVTVHRGEVPNLAAAIGRLTDHAAPLPAPIMLLHRVVDTLVDSFMPALDAMDGSIDALEDAILRRPTEEQLGDLFRLKRALGTVRRLVSGQRDVFASLHAGDEELPGMTAAAERYFRDVYDHLVRASQAADALRDLLLSVVDAHLSTTSNRLNVITKQLTIIATVFLPLSFVTGFFGQNFGWMVEHVTSAWAFWVGGVAVQVAIVIALLVMFRRKGWTARSSDE
jgi:magnesium transporter